MGDFIVTHQMLFTTINQMREETVFSKKKKKLAITPLVNVHQSATTLTPV